MKTRTAVTLAASTALIGAMCVAFGASTREPAPQPQPQTVGQQVGEAIDTTVEHARTLSDSAISWLKKTKEKGLKELDRRIEAAKAAAPAPTVGVHIISREATGGSLTSTPVEAVQGSLPKTLVILVHGFNEPGGIFDDLAPALLSQGHAVATFHYPNDQAIAASATLLGDTLRSLQSRGVTQVAFVAHSMGGLIVRDVLTSPAFYASVGSGHKDLPAAARFVMVDTPNIGSNLAHAAWFAEARESVVRWANSDSKDPAILLGALKDGDGAAADDLVPGSAYLTDLNARTLPKDVAITAIVGIAGEEAGDGLGELLALAKSRNLIDDSQADAARGAIRRAVRDLGDGIVSEATQVPDGVVDVVRVRGFHRTILKSLDLENAVRDATGAPRKAPPAIAVILARLHDLLPQTASTHE